MNDEIHDPDSDPVVAGMDNCMVFCKHSCYFLLGEDFTISPP